MSDGIENVNSYNVSIETTYENIHIDSDHSDGVDETTYENIHIDSDRSDGIENVNSYNVSIETIHEDMHIDSDQSDGLDEKLTDNHYSNIFMQGVINHLQARRSNSKYLFEMLYSFFGDQVHDKEVQQWVYTKLKMRRCRFKQRYEDFFFPKVQVCMYVCLLTSKLPHQSWYKIGSLALSICQ